MIVKVSTVKRAEIDLVVKAVRENYRRAVEQNERRPGFIRDPAAWALYKTWRMFDRR